MKTKTLAEKKTEQLRTLSDDAITVIRKEDVRAFTKGWLGKKLGVDKSATSQVISQLKKDEFLVADTSNFGDFQDPLNRGKYYHVRETALGQDKWANGKVWKKYG